MIGIKDWEKIKKRYNEYWMMENHDRPLFRITGIKEKRDSISDEHVSIEKMWMDSEYIISEARKSMENRIYGGEALPILCADFGPDIFGAILGDDIKFSRDTSWAKHVFKGKDFSSIHLEFDENNDWWKKIQQKLMDLTADSNGDYLVGFADWHGGCDALVSLFGPEDVIYALCDCPEEVKRLNDELSDIFQIIMNRSYDIVRPYQEGSTHWIGLWHPGLWYTTSCDFNILLSPQMFEEFVLPPLQKDLGYLETSIYHLDGPGAFRHLDKLLEVSDLHGIQLVYGAGAPPALHWLPELKSIQAAGKGIHLTCLPSELETLLSELRPEGLFLDVQPDWENGKGPFSQDEVERISSKIEQFNL